MQSILILIFCFVVFALSFFFDSGKYGHTVKQYSPLGKLMQVLGTPGNAGSSLIPLQFDQPADLFVEETGEIYVVDGDGGMNNRLIKLSDGMEKKTVAVVDP